MTTAPQPSASTEDDAPSSPSKTYETWPSVHVGRDGWLFLVEGTNNVIRSYRFTRSIGRRLRAWRTILRARARRLHGLGIGYLHVMVPEKLTVYDHKLDGLNVAVRLAPALRVRRGLWWSPRARRACLDLVGLFRAARGGTDLFLRTDSHWSFEGRLLAYRAICAALRARPVEDFPERPSRTFEAYVGDLGEKLDPPVSETVRLYDLQRDAVRVDASPIVLAREAVGRADTLHVGARVVYRNAAAHADPRRVVLFGDSYAHFTPIMLTVMLAESFAEVHFIWSAAVDWGYVERVRPDLVITEIAERFMNRVPDDDFDLDAYADERFGAELAGTGHGASG